ncbi:uncharacterized protein KIAA0564-like isoform 1 [Anopheles sinensis]|uniref:Uncharacterized protein KIAA0564-like isoform 1 n=1 Tax=Anopheles sinensis TaxID=74873 RepID=A0A084VMV8_ANOSI|nr:uncharacterized protein KIAA0564-like isoform 1 [Anopheles sinensis]
MATGPSPHGATEPDRVSWKIRAPAPSSQPTSQPSAIIFPNKATTEGGGLQLRSSAGNGRVTCDCGGCVLHQNGFLNRTVVEGVAWRRE